MRKIFIGLTKANMRVTKRFPFFLARGTLLFIDLKSEKFVV